MSSSEDSVDQVVELYVAAEEVSSEDPPMSEWSSLEVEIPEVNKKRVLNAQGLYSPGSGEICARYLTLSDSAVFRHSFYNYPAVTDPGIKEALLQPDKPEIYPDDGQKLYMALCLQMNTCPVRMFHRNLLTEEINLSYYGVTPAGVRAMATAIQFNKTVKSLNFTENFLSDDACYHFGHMLASNITLKELNLTGCRIGCSGIIRLGPGLVINRTLTTLNLSRNELSDDGGKHFADNIIKGCTVPQVNLSKNKLGSQAALALMEAFYIRNVITHLDLSWNILNSPATAKMLEELAYSEVLKVLNLSWNSLQGPRISTSIQSIMRIPTITHLDLSNNKFANDDIPILISNLGKCKKLETFDLSFNPLTQLDANVVLSKMLQGRVKVKNLLLDNIWVDKPFLAILKRVKGMKSRKNFTVTYGGVLENYEIEGPDIRKLLLMRADYLGKCDKKNRLDIALIFLEMKKHFLSPIVNVSEVLDYFTLNEIVFNEGLLTQIGAAFPGPKRAKAPMTVNLGALADYVQRLWPERKLPPTPLAPLTPEPDPKEPESEPIKKGKKGAKK